MWECKKIMFDTMDMTISEINKLINQNWDNIKNLNEITECLKVDNRKSAIKLLHRCKGRIDHIEEEIDRLKRLNFYENRLRDKDCKYIVGIDEAGRGPLAGPVVAAAVVLPSDCIIYEINDSKKLSEAKRNQLYQKIISIAISYGVGIVDHHTIDRINIMNATFVAMRKAIQALSIDADFLLVDGNMRIPHVNTRQVAIPGGDSKSISVAAASIVAKVTRDRIVYNFSEMYPQYGFDRNKGYGTKDHIESIKKYGHCPLHRKTFIKKFI